MSPARNPQEPVTIDRGRPSIPISDIGQPFSDDTMMGFLDEMAEGKEPGRAYRAKDVNLATIQWARRQVMSLNADIEQRDKDIKELKAALVRESNS